MKIDPEFMINIYGKVFCEIHSTFLHFKNLVEEYHELVTNNQTAREILEQKSSTLRRELKNVSSCNSCEHFENNNCFFSKKYINKIRLKLKLKRYKCKLCGWPIHEIFNIIYKEHMKHKLDVTIPLLCCICYENLKKDNIKKAFRRQLIEYSILSVGFLGNFFLIFGLLYFFPFDEFHLHLVVLIGFTFLTLGPSFLFFKRIVRLKITLKKSDLIKNLIKNQFKTNL